MPSIIPDSGSLTNLAVSGFNAVKTGLTSAGSVLSGTASRLLGAGLNPGGLPVFSGLTASSTSVQFSNSGKDWRVKVSVATGSGVLYDMPSAGIMEPIKKTNGVIFPYAPSLTIQHQARYNSQPLTHSNYNNYFYEGSEVQAIQITADFTVQNTAEAAYFLGAIYFFRAATKMFYGESGKYQGAPPPIVYLDGYGTHYLPHVPCVVTSFQHTMPAEVDYIETSVALGSAANSFSSEQSLTPVKAFDGNSLRDAINNVGSQTGTYTSSTASTTNYTTRVPTASQLVVTFQPVYSRSAQRAFNLESFARGELLTKGYL